MKSIITGKKRSKMSFGGGKVFVVGGIHGNEMSGVYAIKNWLDEGSDAPHSLQRYTSGLFVAGNAAHNLLYLSVGRSVGRLACDR